MKDKQLAVVLLSGGLDSTTCASIAKAMGYEIYALTVNYGQKQKIEIEKAKKVADFLKIKNHIIININLDQIGGSALTSSNITVPKNREINNEIPITYVPARNTIFLSLALALAETISSSDIFIGVNAVDYSGYPDCRPQFIDAYEKLASLATKQGVGNNIKYKIHTPLINLSKSEIIKKGIELGVDYSITHSCYDPDINGKPCESCDACVLRQKGFEEAGISDPIWKTK